MSYETLRLIRNILYRTFVIGLVFALIMIVVTVACWDTGMAMAARWFHADAALFTPIVIQFFVTLRFFLVFVILAPALAIHWTLNKENAS